LYVYFYISDTIGPTYLLHPSPALHFKTVKAFLIYFSKCPLSLSKIFTLLRIHSYEGDLKRNAQNAIPAEEINRCAGKCI